MMSVRGFTAFATLLIADSKASMGAMTKVNASAKTPLKKSATGSRTPCQRALSPAPKRLQAASSGFKISLNENRRKKLTERLEHVIPQEM